MATTITADNGTSYHLYQLPELASPEPSDEWEFTTLNNDLSDGYRSSLLFGSENGLRRWKLQLPTNPHRTVLSATVTDPSGASVSREEYVRSLYAENVITGTPFAFRDFNTGQFYLVDFTNKSLSRDRLRVKIFSTGLDLQQVRIPGVTVFDVGQLDDQYTTDFWLNGGLTFNSGTGVWSSGTDRLGEGQHGASMQASGDVILGTALQNDLDIVRFSTSASTGLVNASSSLNIYEAFFVMKVREATFSNVAGILTSAAAGGTQILLGDITTTKFTSPGAGAGFTYRLNGLEYEISNMQAPMNAWGIVHVRSTSGWPVTTGWQIGKNRNTAGSFAKIDVGEFIAFGHLLPRFISREITDYLNIKWGIAL